MYPQLLLSRLWRTPCLFCAPVISNDFAPKFYPHYDFNFHKSKDKIASSLFTSNYLSRFCKPPNQFCPPVILSALRFQFPQIRKINSSHLVITTQNFVYSTIFNFHKSKDKFVFENSSLVLRSNYFKWFRPKILPMISMNPFPRKLWRTVQKNCRANLWRIFWRWGPWRISHRKLIAQWAKRKIQLLICFVKT